MVIVQKWVCHIQFHSIQALLDLPNGTLWAKLSCKAVAVQTLPDAAVSFRKVRGQSNLAQVAADYT
jgi:hypothetical protein